MNSLAAFDEYPVENFHSILRARTSATDTGDQIHDKAREIDACKHELHEFKSWFVPARNYSFSPARIKALKVKAAKFLVDKFALLQKNEKMGQGIPRSSGQHKDLSKWVLPNLFGNSVVTNKVLPLGYNDPMTKPSTLK